MKNNYLLIDYGNSYIKAALYDKEQGRIVEMVQVAKTVNPRELLALFDYLSDNKLDVIVESITSTAEYVQPFNAQLKKLFPSAEIKVLSAFDFKDLVDTSNIASDVFIGIDILTSVFYIIKTMKEGAVFSLGTVYFCVVCKNKQISNCYLLPNTTLSLKQISSLTTIPHDYIPDEYATIKGSNTSSCFAAGANLSMLGFIDKVAEINKLKPEQIVLTGGDAPKFSEINKKYKEVKNLVLHGLALLVKEKNW